MSFQLETTEQSFAGSDLIHQTVRAMREAYESEKSANNLNQQKIAKKLGLKHRSIVNRWLLGKENMGLRSIGELAWAMNRRAVIIFEKCDESTGNFVDTNPQSVIDHPEDSARIVSVDNASDVWKRARSRLTQSKPVVENVY